MEHNFAGQRLNLSEPAGLAFSRILFVTCPTGKYCREDRCQSFFEFELVPSIRPPLEECEAAGAVTSLGVNHQIIDSPAENLSDSEFVSRLQNSHADLVILAVTFGSLRADMLWTKRISEIMPSALIGLRGAPCYVMAEQILAENSKVSFCIQGEYELVFRDLVLYGLENTSGVVRRNLRGFIEKSEPAYESNLDLLPFPDRSQIKPELYCVRGSKFRQATIHVQRGCPYPCTFCLAHTVSGNKARHRSANSIVREMKQLLKEGITHFYLRAETFTVNKKWAAEVSKAISEECPQAKWVTATRVDCIDDQTVSAMKAGGCYGISFGVDVASPRIGEKVKKAPQLGKAISAMRYCDSHGILSLAYFMIGFIWEDQESLSDTRNFARKARPDLITIHYAHPYPGTPYYEAVRSEAREIVSLKAQSHPAVELKHITEKQLRSFSRKLLLEHYTRPQVLWSIGKKTAQLKFSKLRSQRRKNYSAG